VVVIVATQKPDRDSLPTGVRDNVGTRFGMRVLTQQASDMVLGGGMSVAGYRAHAFGRGDRGVGYLVGATDDVDAEVVNAFYVDTPQAEQIVARARAMREHAGTVTGHAAGVESARRTSLLEDVAGAMQADREHCDQLATRLAAAFPEQYAGWDGPRLAGALRGQGVTVRQVKVDRVNRTGVHRGDVDRALAARDT
jgi:S-DNA-T family DNA segregation ATPase FtsK/SpoIIIE